MKLGRWIGLLGLWVCLGAAIVWCETRDLRVHQQLSDLHRQKRLLQQERARLQVDVHQRTSPPRLIDNVRRLNLDLAPAETVEPSRTRETR
jgi:cell division protein FtsL